jgi:hypothetical protein
MSMYNMINGVDKMAGVLLAMLGLAPGDVGRFRDCYLAKGVREDDGNDVIHIHIYTRNGGGNREGYDDVFYKMRKHDEYVTDYDDDFDCTYATIVFKVPAKYKEVIDELVGEIPGVIPPSPQEKFDRFLSAVKGK